MSSTPRSRKAFPVGSKSTGDRRAAPGGKARGKPPANKPAVVAGPGGGVGILARVSPEQLEQALGVVLALNGPADTLLRDFFRRHPDLGRRDRGVVAETAFDVLRNRRLYTHLTQSVSGPLPRRLMAISLCRRHGQQAVAALALSAGDELALQQAMAIELNTLDQAVRLSLPDWLYEALRSGFSTPSVVGSTEANPVTAPDPIALLETLGLCLLQPAPLDLRVNLLKSDRASVMAALKEAGIEAELIDGSTTAIRVSGKPAIERLAAFTQGWFEVQDAGSQRLVEFAAPRRGQTVVDFCAGAGGKTLAMAAAMRSSGQIYACDVSAARLQRLRPRLLRSGASNVQPFGLDSENDPKLRRLAGRADLVLVDAPCSGTGTLRRNPELKWRLQPESIDELSRLQTSILESAARLVKPGGALVYATCSLLRPENESVVAAFGAAHPEFAEPTTLSLRPDESGSDGFFAARWVRNPL